MKKFKIGDIVEWQRENSRRVDDRFIGTIERIDDNLFYIKGHINTAGFIKAQDLYPFNDVSDFNLLKFNSDEEKLLFFIKNS